MAQNSDGCHSETEANLLPISDHQKILSEYVLYMLARGR
jgi:hypothetical protein